MELKNGVCGICSSSTLILNSEYSANYCNLIYSHFEEELNISSESKTNFNLCPTCVYQITLINTKKTLLNKEYTDDGVKVSDKCALCKQNEPSFKIADTSFLNKCKSWMSIKDRVSLCTSCFYIIEVNNVLKNHIMQKLSLKDDNIEIKKSSPKIRTILRRRKSTYEVGECSLKETDETNLQPDTFGRKKRKLEEQNSPNSMNSLQSTPIKSKRRRSKNLGELLDKESKSLELKNPKKGQETIDLFQKNFDFNLSSISHFSPLCKTDFHIKKKIELDEKMYNCIPFVKMQNIEETSIKKEEGNYVCSLVSQRPMIRVRRTPPIKIKTIKVLNKVKKNVQEKKQKQSIGEISKQKLVVKVERMKLHIPCKDDVSKEETTPKKKKRVHFNDTPTIIITEDDYYDDYRIRRNNRTMPENPDLKKVEIVDEDTEKIEEEKSDSEELITLSLEESDDDLKEDPMLHSTEENTGEKESETQSTEEITSKNIPPYTVEKSSNDEDINGETEELKECKEISSEEDFTSKDDCVIEVCENNEEDNGRVIGEETAEDEKESLDDCVLVDCEDDSENDNVIHAETDSNQKVSLDDGRVIGKETTEDEEQILDDCALIDSEDDSENDSVIHEKNAETDQKVSLDECAIVECQDNSENDKVFNKEAKGTDRGQKYSLDDYEMESSEKCRVVDTNTVETSEDKKVETCTLQEKEESIDMKIKKNCSEKDVEDEKSKNESIEKTNPKTNVEESNRKSDAKTDFEDEVLQDVMNVCPHNNERNEIVVTENYSLDGFEVIDEENGDSSDKSTEKESLDKDKESSDNIEEIEILVRKYCEEKENSIVEKTDKENTVENAPEEDKSQEETENNSNKTDSAQESEDFGSLIDEVQKCLTVTKDLLDKTEAETEEKRDEDLGLDGSELAQILDCSFDENSTNTVNSPETCSGNEGLKRKNLEEGSDNKREKIDISGV